MAHTLTAGNTGGAWDLDAATGELKLTQALDYETTPSYQLTIEARSGPAAATVVPVTITVTNVDEPPVFGTASYAFSVAEDVATATTLGTVTATDPEGGEVIYDISAGNTGGVFVVDSLAGRIVVGARLDYETTPSYTLTVRAQDPQRHAATATVTITVTDVVDALAAPTNLAATPAATSLALAWDAVPDARRYRVDYRVADTETWSTAARDVRTTSYTLADLTCGTATEVQVRAFGAVGNAPAAWSAPSTTLATATSACPPPAFGETAYAFSVAEDSATGTDVGTVTATTTGAGPVTYALTAGNDAGHVALDAGTGALTVAAALDYETAPSYSLTVEARTGGAATATVPVTVTVTNVNEAPVFGAASYAFSVAEDAAIGATIGTAAATDPEGGTVVYDIRAGNDSLTFAVHALTGGVVLGGRLNAATTPSYTLTIRAAVLEGGPSATTTVTITVTSSG